MTRAHRTDIKAPAEWVSIDSLTPWDKNPRRNAAAVADVAKSIKRFGFGSPILVRDADSVVIAGHTRLLAARSLGLDKVLIRRLDLDPAEARALALADNKLGELAEWDEALLSEVIQGLDAESVDFDGLGFSDEELAELLGTVSEPGESNEEAPEVEQGPACSEVGQVYELGPHRLICGSCREPDVVAKLLDGAQINVAFTSPPYASQRKYDESSGFKPIRPDDYVEWFDAVQANVREHLAEDGSWFVNIKEHCEAGQRHLYVKDLTIAHVRQWGWMFIDEFCWKRGGVPGKWGNRFKNSWEPVFHFALGASLKLRHGNVSHESNDVVDYSPQNPTTHSGFISTAVGGRRSGMALPSNLLEVYSNPSQTNTSAVKHTATFPVGLPDWFIRAFSDAGDTIFDPFLGSGTTLIAAAQEGRVAYGCEISPSYCDVIRRRWTRWAKEHGQDPGSGALDG
jgi:DNA modification methylase